MHYFCEVCTNRVEGKLGIEVVIICKTCGRYYTLAELIEYNSTAELRTINGLETKRLGGCLQNSFSESDSHLSL